MEHIEHEFSLKSFVKDTIKFYFDILEYVKNGCLHYWKYSLLLLLVFVALFYYKSTKIQTYYTAKSSYTFNYRYKKFFGEILHYFEELIANGEHQTLAKTLNIPLSTATSMLGLRAENIANAPLHEDFSDRRVPFYVFVETTDKNLLPSIQTAITDYIINDSISVARITEINTDLAKQLSWVEGEIAFLDSVKMQFIDSIDLKRANEDIKPLLKVYEDKVRLKIYLETTIRSKHSITLRIPFQAIERPQATQFKKAAVKYALVYILMSLFITTVLFWYKQVNNES